MEQAKKRVPKRRFKEFQNAEAWVQCKLEDISEIIGGGTPSTSNNVYWDGNIDWYAPAEIDEQIYASGSKRKITELGLKNSSAKILPPYKTILFTSRAGIGKTAILSQPGATNQGFQSLVLKDEYTPYFIYSISNQIKEKAEAIASGSTFLEISGKMLGKLEIMVPKKTEQDKIGEFFKNLDNLITLHQRKLDKIKSTKKAYLNEMFPAEGESKPKRRFKGFTEDWELCKLNDAVDIVMGQSPDGSTYTDTPSDHILVQGNADLKDGWVYPRIWTTQATKKANAGDLIMSVRAPAGEMGKTSYNVVLGRGVAAIKGNEFVFQSLLKMNDDGYWKKLSSGSTFDSLNSDNIKNSELFIPSQPEQDVIGEFFINLDNLITLHQHKLDKLKNLKKSYLNEMFI